MSDVYTAAGTIISVSDTLPTSYDDDASDGFPSLSFTEVGEVTDLGEFGRVYEQVVHNPLNNRRTIKRKGSYDDGEVSMVVARTPGDAGQTILQTGLDSDDSISVKVELQSGDVLYFSVQVMSYTANVGTINQIVQSSVTLAIDNDIVEVAAA